MTSTPATPGLLGMPGEVAQDLLRVDWSATPLGLTGSWPQSLKSAVRTMLASRFAMWMCWGEELTFFCNDAYRRDTLGAKYPWALGQPASTVWAEIWPDIGPRIDQVLHTGEATWDEGLMLFLERSGYPEETYHTFSYSPLTGDDGGIRGMLCVVVEETDRVINERHIVLLRDLGGALAKARGFEETTAAISAALATEQRSLPFALVYDSTGNDADDGEAALVSCAGIKAGEVNAPEYVSRYSTSPWPLAEVGPGQQLVVESPPAGLPTGAWDRPPKQVLIQSLSRGDHTYRDTLVVGLNPFRPLDDAYASFLDLLAGQLATALDRGRAYDAERARAEALAELDRAKTAFFTNVSHEFRTPLTLLLGPAEDALRDDAAPLTGDQRQRIEVVHRNAERLLKLVNTLLQFNRLQSGESDLAPEPTYLADHTAELAETFRHAFDRAGLALKVEVEPVGIVLLDREMWAKIVLNLLSNALKHTFDGGVTLTLKRCGDDGPRLEVSDTGVGIAAEHLPTLFDRFQRVSGARSRSFEGSGIGLALVAELTHLHGGTVTVTSEPDVGSTFAVMLPASRVVDNAEALVERDEQRAQAAAAAVGYLAEADVWMDDAPSRSDGASEEGAVPDTHPTVEPSAGDLAHGGARTTGAPTFGAAGDSDSTDAAQPGRPVVLVVDDNADMRDHISHTLAADYDVVTAGDGVAALARARAQPPDLIVTDVMMPRLDGFGLLAALHADPATTAIPVVMLSARAGEEARVEGLEAGADDYLPKPFSARELLARVRANLELDRVRRTRDELARSRELMDQAQRLARVGSWEFDLERQVISGSEQFLRQSNLMSGSRTPARADELFAAHVHPDDQERVRAAMFAAEHDGAALDFDLRLVQADGAYRTFHVVGEAMRDESGTVVALRGSQQDVTDAREAEQTLRRLATSEQVAAREHAIAEELQRSLLPDDSVSPDALRVAGFYRAGVEGTQVGGDWYDVIELASGRTALVLGDVMGRGVRAAAVMGQLRAAVRAYARLDLPPADILEFLDGAVRDLGTDDIVTCVYAVFDPSDRMLTWANAGHLPPLHQRAHEVAEPLEGVAGPPLGTGPFALTENSVMLEPGSRLLLYTDGLVERRDRDIDDGIGTLATALSRVEGDLTPVPAALVEELLAGAPSDDVALLIAEVPDRSDTQPAVVLEVEPRQTAVADTRHAIATQLDLWHVGESTADSVILLASELVTNALLYARSPVQVRLRRTATHVMLEVRDGTASVPRIVRPSVTDEHGRGLQLTQLLADSWGSRPEGRGKSVWCAVRLV